MTDPLLPRPVPPLSDVSRVACETHPARAGAGLCRSCLRTACAECLTRIDGVNHCAGCIDRLFPPPGAGSSGPAGRPAGTPAAFEEAKRRSPRHLLALLALYGTVAVSASAAAVAWPFLLNERRLEANRQRLVELHLALSEYLADVSRYPSPERGLKALLEPSREDRDDWRGPYATARAGGTRASGGAANDDAVLDVFGRPVLYHRTPEDVAEPRVYLASPGANGLWDTAGIVAGNPPHEAGGDDALQWVVTP